MNIHLFSLTEDTFFLALEDIHSRVRGLQNLHKQDEKSKPKFYSFSNEKERKQKEFDLATDHQKRQLIRNRNKIDKLNKKEIYSHYSNEPREKQIQMYNLAKKQNAKDSDDATKNTYAVYSPRTNAIGVNKNLFHSGYGSLKRKRENFHTTLSHELRHKAQYDTIRSKYGQSAVLKAHNRNMPDNKKIDGYWHDPREFDARNTEKKTKRGILQNKINNEINHTSGGKMPRLWNTDKKILNNVARTMVGKSKPLKNIMYKISKVDKG